MRSALMVLSGCLAATVLCPAITHGDRLPAGMSMPAIMEGRPALAPAASTATAALSTPVAARQRPTPALTLAPAPVRQLSVQGSVSTCGTVHTQSSSRFTLTGGCVPAR